MNETSVASLDASNELLQLQARVKWMDVLMRQNAALEGEVNRLCEELDEATRGVLKRGYLYKYRYLKFTVVCCLTAVCLWEIKCCMKLLLRSQRHRCAFELFMILCCWPSPAFLAQVTDRLFYKLQRKFVVCLHAVLGSRDYTLSLTSDL